MLKSLSTRGGATAPKANDADVRYLAARQFSPQWRAVLLTMADELFGNFSAEEAWGFYRQIGLRVSGEISLPAVTTLDELEASINKALAELDWGFVALAIGDSEIAIRHCAYPGQYLDDEKGHWRQAFAAILEGVYTVWLRTQGGRPEMKATFQGGPAADVLEFSYGL